MGRRGKTHCDGDDARGRFRPADDADAGGGTILRRNMHPIYRIQSPQSCIRRASAVPCNRRARPRRGAARDWSRNEMKVPPPPTKALSTFPLQTHGPDLAPAYRELLAHFAHERRGEGLPQGIQQQRGGLDDGEGGAGRERSAPTALPQNVVSPPLRGMTKTRPQQRTLPGRRPCPQSEATQA